ncbi:MAG: GAF domain-containing protein, partial [Anaerolineales bacterium]
MLPAYRNLTNALGMESAIVAPLVVRERSVGELMIGSSKVNHFNPFDLQIVSTAAGQIAAAIESAELLSQTDDTLRKRVDHLSAIARVTKELGVSLDLRHLLQVIHTEAIHLAQADSATVLLFETNKDSSNPRVQLAVGQEHQPGLSSAERTAIKDNAPFIVSDFIQDGIYPPYEGARSGIILPIAHHSQALGLMSVYSNRAKFFSAETAELMQMLAVQAGIAINNAQRYQAEKQRSELISRRSETLVRLTDVSYSLGHDQPLDQALQIIARGIRDATPFRVVLVSVLETDSNQLRRVTGVGLPQETLNELLSRKQPLASLQQLMRPEFKTSRSYFIPADQTPVMPPDLHKVTLDINAPQTKTENSWNAEDIFLVPLENAE